MSAPYDSPTSGSTGSGDAVAVFGPPRSRRHRVMLAGAAVLVVGGAAAAAYLLSRGPAPAAEAMAEHDHGAVAAAGGAPTPVVMSAAQASRIGVTYATVRRAPLSREIRAVGLVAADEARVQELSLKVDGWVERLAVNTTGQYVARGAPLLALYSPMLVAAQEDLLVAKRLSDQLAGAGEVERVNAQELLASARARLAYWDVPDEEIAAIEAEGRTRRAVTFPSRGTGRVLEKRVVEGQRVMAGEPLFRIADLSAVWVEAEIFARDMSSVRVGQGVSVEFETLPGARRRALVTFIQPTMDVQSRTVRVRAELRNADGALRPGMYATLRFTVTTGAATLSVPRSAVLATGERALVFVRDADGSLSPRDVRLGERTDDRVEIVQGLADGDVVVSSATFLVDAESSLRSLAGGSGDMAGMPGMKMEQP
ncbi:MAG: efflux RND transporter periplasmic adaptor subunit [Gemmatimonadales bacterium]|nr:efflux RND transporter periplasmic adaptor subunit [Gemmatimonadota bacterium]MCL4214077.1 efflux RND transporter periplasmic adaptor subunit [Gemmatimonadales bacterium]